ncbi:MAG: FHA domain-containing protein [Deltaproteobacteria bacterium]|nr:FHA domain-containing protein [Deltaproteobacteria bacterium]
MAKETKSEVPEVEIPLNKGLLDEASKFKEERQLLKERLAKIEAGRSQVTKNVFEKVYGDYADRLQKITDRLMEKKQDIDRELGTLYETRDKIQAGLKNHKEVLEELKFRQQLGEFGREDFQSKSREQEDKIERFEKVLSGILSNIRRYEALFKGQEDLLDEAPLVSRGEAGDVWEAGAAEEGAALSRGEGPIGKGEGGTGWEEATKPNLQAVSQITILSGTDNVGKSFPVNDTVSIGRSHTNKVILKDSKVSRQHAEIKMRGSECILIDLNSSNGTMVNGQKIHEHILSPNDEIQIGDTLLQYRQ